MDNIEKEVAVVAVTALERMLLPRPQRAAYAKAFIDAAGESMPRPERLEDVDAYATRIADMVLTDPEFHDMLVFLFRTGIIAYMRPR